MMKYERLTKKGGLDFSDKSLCLADEWGYSHIYNRLAELEDKIEQGKMIDILTVSKLFEKLYGAPCDYGFDDESVIDVILNNTDDEWCERECHKNDYAKCWEQYIRVKLKELQNG